MYVVSITDHATSAVAVLELLPSFFPNTRVSNQDLIWDPMVSDFEDGKHRSRPDFQLSHQ